MKLLIAEDDKALQKMVGLLATQWGFDFDLASNGREAVEQAQLNDGAYDLCLMDIDMPIMTGLEATKIIREHVKYFPVMALTGNPGNPEQYFAAGMDDFLKKPYAINTLKCKITDLTTKVEKIYLTGENIKVTEETPMNSEELQELISLKKQGLTKLKLVGTGATFVVHKNIQNKISHDIVGEGKELSEFIDRSACEPGRCHLYKTNLHVTKDIFTPDELADAIRKEDEDAENFMQAVDKKNKD